MFELQPRALRDVAGKSRLAERGACPGERESERARVRARARAPRTAQGEGSPRQPLGGTVVEPPNNFNCQSDLMGY